jgi:hypothetical protein
MVLPGCFTQQMNVSNQRKIFYQPLFNCSIAGCERAQAIPNNLAHGGVFTRRNFIFNHLRHCMHQSDAQGSCGANRKVLSLNSHIIMLKRFNPNNFESLTPPPAAF